VILIGIRFKLLAAAVLAGGALLAPGGASAQVASPAADQYNRTCSNCFVDTGGSPPSAGSPGVGSLPFTGAELGTMAIVAAALGAGGLAMRRGARRTEEGA
jgi:hypothetical protein